MGILIKAVKNNDLEEVKFVLKDFPDSLFKLDKYGQSPLHYSAEKGNLEITKFLLDKGLKNTIDKSGHSPLFFACRENHAEVVKLLLENGFKDNYSILGDCALRGSVFDNNIEIVKYLIEYPQDIENYKEIGLEYTCSFKGRVDIVKLLLDKGANINYQDKTSLHTSIMTAVQSSDVITVQLLRERGAGLKIKGRYGETVFDLCRKKEIRDVLTSPLSYKVEKVERFLDF